MVLLSVLPSLPLLMGYTWDLSINKRKNIFLPFVVRSGFKTVTTHFHFCRSQDELLDRQARRADFFSSLPQWSTWLLKGPAVGISHNACSHRETSSQHEQGWNVARVWERPCGWREGVTDQRARSREGRKEGVCREGSRGSLNGSAVSVLIRIRDANERNNILRRKNMYVPYCLLLILLQGLLISGVLLP